MRQFIALVTAVGVGYIALLFVGMPVLSLVLTLGNDSQEATLQGSVAAGLIALGAAVVVYSLICRDKDYLK